MHSTPHSTPIAEAIPNERSVGGLRRRTSLMLLPAVLAMPAVAHAEQPRAIARPKPSITFTVPAAVDVRTPITYSWSARRIPAKAQLLLQRQVGTGKVWRTISTLSSRSGTGTLKEYASKGVYPLRIAAIERHPRQRPVTHGSTLRRVSVYDRVPFSTLLENTEKSYTGPTFTFTYIDASTIGSVREPSTAITVNAATNTCRHVHVDTVMTTASAGNRFTGGIVSVVQEAADSVSVAVPVDVVTGLDADVIPGRSWSVTIASDSATSSAYPVLNGWASCTTNGPLRPGTGKS